MASIRQTETGRASLAEFHPGMRISIWGHTDAFVLGRTDTVTDLIDLLWVDAIGYIVVMPYTLEQCRRMVLEESTRNRRSVTWGTDQIQNQEIGN